MNQSESKQTISAWASEICLEPRSRSLVAAIVAVEVGDILLRVIVRRFRNGELGVQFPTCTFGDSCLDAFDLPGKLRAEVEKEVLSLYGAREDQEDIEINEH